MYKRDWATALINAGFEIPLNRSEFNISCPFHGDRTPSLSINLDKGQWICHTNPEDCGRGNIRLLLSKYLDISVFDAEKLAFTNNSYLLTNSESLFPDLDFKEEQNEITLLPEVDFPFSKESVPQWIFNREFDVKTLVKWECGLDTYNGSLGIPVSDEFNRKVGWLKRQPEGWNPKYLYSSGLKKSKLLFGYNHYNLDNDYELNNCMLLTEGPLDTMWLDQHNYPSIALLGLFMSKIQEKLISKIPIQELILCLDNDEPGQNAINGIQNRLKKFFIISKIELPEGVKDVQDVRNKEQLETIINNRTIF